MSWVLHAASELHHPGDGRCFYDSATKLFCATACSPLFRIPPSVGTSFEKLYYLYERKQLGTENIS